MSTVISWAVLFGGIISLLLKTYTFIGMSQKRLESKSFRSKFGALYEEIKLDEASKRAYPFIFLLRRLIQSNVILYLKTSGCLQV